MTVLSVGPPDPSSVTVGISGLRGVQPKVGVGRGRGTACSVPSVPGFALNAFCPLGGNRPRWGCCLPCLGDGESGVRGEIACPKFTPSM